jgi:hypothetical protein
VNEQCSLKDANKFCAVTAIGVMLFVAAQISSIHDIYERINMRHV